MKTSWSCVFKDKNRSLDAGDEARPKARPNVSGNSIFESVRSGYGLEARPWYKWCVPHGLPHGRIFLEKLKFQKAEAATTLGHGRGANRVPFSDFFCQLVSLITSSF